MLKPPPTIAQPIMTTMNLRKFIPAAALTVAFLLPAQALAANNTAAGHWEGPIQLPGTKLQIKVDIDQPIGSGEWSGTIDIPAQRLRGFALGNVAVDGNTVSFAMPNIPGDPIFNGTLSEDANTLSGTFQQGGKSFPFSLQRTEHSDASGETPSRGIPGEGLADLWQGSLRVGPSELLLVLHVDSRPDGSFKATLDSVDQGAIDIPVSSIESVNNEVQFKITKIGGAYEGAFNDNESEIKGTWSQGGNQMPLVFKRIEQVPDTSRPQDPKKPYPYDEREVTIENANAGIQLAGTLTTPRGDGDFPAVVLITGSGAQNRDEELMGHRPFLVLADHLTRNGIAVLRFDDRGVGKSKGNHGKATHDDFADDARAAFEFLKVQDKIDPDSVGLSGHSEGGIHAPIVAAGRDDIAFIVMLAGVGVPMDELLERQRNDMIASMGMEHMLKPEELELNEKIFEILRRNGATPEARNEVQTLLEEILALYTEAQLEALGINDSMIQQNLQMMFSPWFIKLIAYDPAPTLAHVQCPVLAINGEKDIQVAADENLEGIRSGLKAGGNENVTIVKLPELNHLFQQCDTGAISEYSSIEETFNPAALKLVSDWILAITSAPEY